MLGRVKEMEVHSQRMVRSETAIREYRFLAIKVLWMDIQLTYTRSADVKL